MNEVHLIGRLTADVEVKKSASGMSYARFCVAVRERGSKDQADFIDCICFGSKAENLAKYMHKGYLVAASGNISTSYYNAPDGQRKKNCEVLCHDIEFLEPKRGNGEAGQSYEGPLPFDEEDGGEKLKGKRAGDPE